MRCSPRWRTSRTRRSPSGPPQCAQRPRPSSGSPGAQDRARIPVRALDRPRDDVLEAAEGGLALALGLGRAEALVARRPRPRTSCTARRSSSAAEPSLAGGDRPAIVASRWPTPLKIVVLEGDETGQELLEQALRVLDPDVLGLELELERYDLSLEHRRATANEVVARGRARRCARPASASRRRPSRPRARDDVGSPNRILREEVDGKVIIRTGRRIPGVTPIAGVHHPISVVRMAVEDAYGAKQWREGDRGRARRGRLPHREDHALDAAARSPSTPSARRAQMGGKVYGGPKWTVSPVYEGMLKEELDAAAARHPEVDLPAGPHRRDLRRADLRRRRRAARHPRAQPRRRLPQRPRDADVRLDRRRRVGAAGLRRGLRDPGRDGRGARTAPRRRSQGKDVANPMAMILACGAVLHYAGVRGSRGRRARLARDLRVASSRRRAAGVRTPDLGGHATTTEFTERGRRARAHEDRRLVLAGHDASERAAPRRAARAALQVRLQHRRFRPTPA